MKIRNLEAQYDNLHPDHVKEITDDRKLLDPLLYFDQKYMELWNYARSLEIALQKSRDKTNMYLREVRVVNQAMWRTQALLKPVRWLARLVRRFQRMFED